MSSNLFNIQDKALILRFTRLGRLPPALYAAELLEKSGIETLCLEYGNTQEPQEQVPASPPRLRWSTPLARVVPKMLRPLFILVSTLLRLIMTVNKEGAPRFTISHGNQENILAYVLNKIFLIPYVVHVHEIYDRGELKGFLNKLLFDFESTILRNAKFLIFPEEERKNIYVKRYELTCPTFIIPNCPKYIEKVTPVNLRKNLKLPADSILLAYLGGIGHDNMILEGIKAIKNIPNLYFLLWGWSDEKYLIQINELTKELNIENRVLLLGELKENKWESFAGADISYCIYRPDLLRMRYQATASNKIFESMACSVPVIAPTSFDFVTKSGIGALAQSMDETGIEDALKKIVQNPLFRYSMGNSGRQLFEKTYHYEKQFRPALEAFQALYFGKEPTYSAA